jgi:hypothetical protein
MRLIVFGILSILFLVVGCSPTPKDVIPMSVPDFRFVEKSERVDIPFDGVEFWAYSLFEPVGGSRFDGKVLDLEVRVHQCRNENDAEDILLIFAGAGTTQEEVVIDGIKATLCYDADSGEAGIVWRVDNFVILSNAIPPFEAITFDERALKDAAFEGAKAAKRNL